MRELNAIIKNKNLDERFELQQKLTDAEERAQNAEQSLRDAQKNIVLQTQCKYTILGSTFVTPIFFKISEKKIGVKKQKYSCEKKTM